MVFQKKTQGSKAPKTQQRPDISKVVLNKEKRYTGTCVYFNRKSGFGFIKLDQQDVVPENKVMVYWRSIVSDDRWPFLFKGLKTEFNLNKARDSIRAVKVSAPKGKKISVQEEVEDRHEFVGQKNMRFLGNVKFYNFAEGYGYVNLQSGYDIPASIPTEIKVERTEIAAGSDAPRLNKGMEVEFGIFKNKKGDYRCYNVTLDGGSEITRTFVENRQMASNSTATGTIMFWNRFKSYGYIKPDNVSKLPAKIQTGMKEAAAKAKAKSGKSAEPLLWFRRSDRSNHDTRIARDVKVSFKTYADNNGVGACDVVCK